MPEHAPPRTALTLFLLFIFIAGIVLIPVGIGLLYTDATVTHVEDYSECHGNNLKRVCVARVVTRYSEHYSECVCPWTFELKKPITGDVTLYYETEFDQTGAAYASSRDESQLRGEPGDAPAHSCGNFSYDGGRPIFPCGELADSMFNDTFYSLKAENEAEPYALSYSGILKGAAATAFRNPPPEVWDKFSKPKSWLSKNNNVWDSGSNVTGVENEAFRAWMDTSLKRKPVFRVVDPALRGGLRAGNYTILIKIHCPLAKYGSKKFVLVGVSARAQAGYVVGGAAALGAGVSALLLGVMVLVIALKRGYYVVNLRAGLGKVIDAVLALYRFVAKNRKVKRVLPYLPVIAGIVLVSIGIGFLAAVHTTTRIIHIEDYSKCHGTDVKHACMAHVTNNYTECVCRWTFELKQPITGDVTLYYETQFDQTGAAYASSRDESQLRGEPGDAPAHTCGNYSYDGGRPIFPCGELADSIFNDTFSSLKLDDESKTIVISYTGLLAEDTAYHNPPEEIWNKFVKPKSWLSRKYNTWESGSNVTGVEVIGSNLTGVENEAFRAWMDTSPKRKPVFRVVDPALRGGLRAGNYTILIKIHGFSDKYGSKKFVLEGVSAYARLINAALGAFALAAGLVVLLYKTVLLLKKNNMFSSLKSPDRCGPYGLNAEAKAANGNPPENENQHTSHTCCERDRGDFVLSGRAARETNIES